MTLTYTLRPISDRTPFAGKPAAGARMPFSASWSSTLKLLERELHHLAGRNVVLELDVRENQIRVDGQLRADASATSTAVRIAFDSRHGPLIYATDRYGYDGWDQPRAQGWQDNVRAIALGMEALRKVDRYGITKLGEQYRGFKALPAGSGEPGTTLTADGAIDFLRSLMRDPETAAHLLPLDQLLRRAKAKTHPDRNHGDRGLWDKVELCERVLRRAGRLS